MTRQPTGRRLEPWWSGAMKITSPSKKQKELIVEYRRLKREHAPNNASKTSGMLKKLCMTITNF
jgi:hypothetical protein